LWALGYRLLGNRMLLGVSDCVGDLIPLQNEWVFQDHLDGRAYVEEKVASVQEQRECGHASNRSAHHGADNGVLRCAAGGSYA
jgi:hypothetical protein